eukprot:gene1966-2237_t
MNANYAGSASESHVASANAAAVARPSDEDVISLFGGADFDSNTNEAIDNDDIDNNALLSLIGDALVQSDVTGPPILEHLANIVDAKFTAEFDIDKRKEILDKYKVPKYCNSLFTPKCNPEIWGKLPSFVGRNDVRASTQQDTLLRVTGAISSSIEDLLKACEEKQTPENKAIIAKLFDAIAILGHFNNELSFKRREALKPNLSNEFKQTKSGVEMNLANRKLALTAIQTLKKTFLRTKLVLLSIIMATRRFQFLKSKLCRAVLKILLAKCCKLQMMPKSARKTQ